MDGNARSWSHLKLIREASRAPIFDLGPHFQKKWPERQLGRNLGQKAEMVDFRFLLKIATNSPQLVYDTFRDLWLTILVLFGELVITHIVGFIL